MQLTYSELLVKNHYFSHLYRILSFLAFFWLFRLFHLIPCIYCICSVSF